MIRHDIRRNRTRAENRTLLLELILLIDFHGPQQRVGRIFAKDFLEVFIFLNVPVICHIGIIALIKDCLCISQRFVIGTQFLQFDNLPDRFAHLDGLLDFTLLFTGQSYNQLGCLYILKIEFPVLIKETIGLCIIFNAGLLGKITLHAGWLIGFRETLHRFGQLVLKGPLRVRLTGHIIPKGCALLIKRPHNVFRVFREIRIDGDIRLALEWLAMNPCRKSLPILQHKFTFLEYKDIGCDFRACCFECIVRKPDGTDQFAATGQIFSGLEVSLIHGTVACDGRYKAARAHLVHHLGQEVVMNQEVVLCVFRVHQSIVAKRDIANGQIKGMICIPGGFKALDIDLGFGIQVFCHTAREGIQFNAIEMAVLLHFLWHISEEAANAHGWFQNSSILEAHFLKSMIHFFDDTIRREMRIEHGRPCGSIFLIGQKFFEFFILSSPVGFGGIKSVRDSPKTGKPFERFIFFWCCFPVLRFQPFQHADCLDIPLEYPFWGTGCRCRLNWFGWGRSWRRCSLSSLLLGLCLKRGLQSFLSKRHILCRLFDAFHGLRIDDGLVGML